MTQLDRAGQQAAAEAAGPPGLVVRERRPEDVEALLAILLRTHEQVGYPVRASAVSSGWLATPGELAAATAVARQPPPAAVAKQPPPAAVVRQPPPAAVAMQPHAPADRVVGHVALHPADDADHVAALPQWQRATGRAPAELAVVSRLFTDGSVAGTGTALLTDAIDRAAELGRLAVLLVDPDSPARAFYRRRGWRETGTVVQQWGHRTVDAVLMVPLTAAAAGR